jgi:hypothetical protein
MAATCLQFNDSSDLFGEENFRIHDYEYDLMTAADYFNKLLTIKEMDNNPLCLHTRIDYFGNPRHLAVIGGHHEAVDLLFSAVHKNQIDNQKINVLGIACEPCSIDIAKKLLPRWTIEDLERERSSGMQDLERSLYTPSVEISEMIMRIKEATVLPKLRRHHLKSL